MQGNLLMVKIITKIKLSVLNFWYVMAGNITIVPISFQMNLWVSLKVKVMLNWYCSNWAETCCMCLDWWGNWSNSEDFEKKTVEFWEMFSKGI